MINQAEAFQQEMSEIWDEDAKRLYDAWHDARLRARHHGASETGRIDNDEWVEYEFGDSSLVWIQKDGNGVSHSGPPSVESSSFDRNT